MLLKTLTQGLPILAEEVCLQEQEIQRWPGADVIMLFSSSLHYRNKLDRLSWQAFPNRKDRSLL
jgi:hypothetical protein